VTDPFLALREHAAQRRLMTKRQLLDEFVNADDAYINASSERDMAEAYYKTLEDHLREVHRCTHDFAVVADGLSAEELDPNAEWNGASD
jgi:hypothetical protein